MDSDLFQAVGNFVAALALNTVGQALLSHAGHRLVAAFKSTAVADPKASAGVSVLQAPSADEAMLADAQSILGDVPVLRRAVLARHVLLGARILWVDDHPRNNLYERATLLSFGAEVEFVRSTAEAAARLVGGTWDLVISDMERDGNPGAGLELAQYLATQGCQVPIIIYLLTLDPSRGVPAWVFGITNRPDELLNLVLDVLERSRV